MQKWMFDEHYGLESAVLNGTKTMTRRNGMKPSEKYNSYVQECRRLGKVPMTLREYAICPVKVGDLVAVAQSYRNMGYDPMYCPIGLEDGVGSSFGWNNKMYVRADLCKRHVEVTGVDYQMLWDITDEDCMREGIIKIATPHLPVKEHYTYINSGMISETPKAAFAHLIRRLCGDSYWESDPYNYVFSFILKD